MKESATMTRNAETPAAVESDEAPATETVDTPAPRCGEVPSGLRHRFRCILRKAG